MLFNAWLLEDELVFRGLQAILQHPHLCRIACVELKEPLPFAACRVQELEIQSPSDFSPDAMAWPLVPPAPAQISCLSSVHGRYTMSLVPWTKRNGLRYS